MAFTVSKPISDPQEAALTALLSLYAARGIVPSPPPTAEEYLNARVDEVISELRNDYVRARAKRIREAMDSAQEADIAAAEAALGIS